MQNNLETEIKNNFSFIKSKCQVLAWPHSGDDLFSTVLEKLCKYGHKFDGTNFRGWVVTIIKNANTDIYRSPTVLLHDIDYYSNIVKVRDESRICETETLEIIKKVVQKRFSKKYNMFFDMYFFQGMKYKEISEATGIRKVTIRVAIKKMKDFLIENKESIEAGLIDKIKKHGRKYTIGA